jgi:hypothetical protein
MAKTAVHMRLDATLLAGADRYAQQREWSRTQVVEKALASFLEDVRGGVPEVPKPAGVSRAVERQAAVRSRPPVAVPDAAPERWGGCSEHPEAGAVLNRGQHWCAEPGCPKTARRLV